MPKVMEEKPSPRSAFTKRLPVKVPVPAKLAPSVRDSAALTAVAELLVKVAPVFTLIRELVLIDPPVASVRPPAEIVVVPVSVLMPESDQVPAPCFTTLPAPLISPAKVRAAASLIVSVPVPRAT